MDERMAVLRRVAVRLGCALFVLGCSTPRPQPAIGAATVLELPEPSSLHGLAEDDLPERAPLRKSATLGLMPSLEVPDGLGESVRRRFEYLVAQITRGHELLDEIEHDMPRCRLRDPACDYWREIAKKALDIESALRWIKPACPGSSEGAKLYTARATAHFDYISARRREVFRPIEEQLERDGEPAQTSWERYLSEAKAARPPLVSLGSVCEDW